MSQGNSYKEIAGIIGGIGPEATNYFTSLLIKFRQPYAGRDQDHIPFLLFNNPQILDRTDYLLKRSKKSPLTQIVNTGIALKKAGATFLVMPCNTAHAFAKEAEDQIGLPFINMLEETAAHIMRVYGENATVGLLATTGTVEARLFEKAFAEKSQQISVLTPDKNQQEMIMKAIYNIKSDSVNEWNTQVLYEAANKLVKRGASIIILGCTEIPLALETKKCHFFRIDPMEILAQKVIERTILNTSHKKDTHYVSHTNMH